MLRFTVNKERRNEQLKKTFALLLLIVLITHCFASLAEHTEAITFQGIPWESSVEETLSILQEKKLITKEYASTLALENEGDIILETGKISGKPYAYDGRIKREYRTHITIDGKYYQDTIAGYQVKFLTFTFALNKGETQLLCVDVGLKYNDTQRFIKEISAKLIKVYGEGEVYDNTSTFAIDQTYLWYGENDTAILIEYFKALGSSKYEAFHFCYGILNAGEILNNIAEINDSDLSGL